MDHPIHDTSPSVLIPAIEENTIEFLVTLGRAAGSEERHDSTIHWTIGGSPIDYHNCVVRAQLPSDAIDTAIQASIERFRAYNVPGSWHVGPSMQPPDLGSYLIAHRFKHAADEPGMAIDIDAMHTDLPVTNDLTIERVTDKHTLTVWTRTLAVGFGAGEQEAAWVGQMYRIIGLTDDQPWRH